MNTGKRAKNLLPNWEELQKAWVARMTELVDRVEGWARELDWSTRRIEKTLRDSQIGTHRVPSLLMQHEFTRALLEPRGAAVADGDGIAYLYQLPEYDDIARLYLDGDTWRLVRGDWTEPSNGREDRPFERPDFEALVQAMKRQDVSYSSQCPPTTGTIGFAGSRLSRRSSSRSDSPPNLLGAERKRIRRFFRTR